MLHHSIATGIRNLINLHYGRVYIHGFYPKLIPWLSTTLLWQILPWLPQIIHFTSFYPNYPIITQYFSRISIYHWDFSSQKYSKWIIHYYHYETIMIITQKSWLSRNHHDDSFTIPELSMTIPERVLQPRHAARRVPRSGAPWPLPGAPPATEGGMEKAGDRGDTLWLWL